jgi:nitrogen fixation protein NifB
MGQMGADIQNCMALCPVEGTRFEDVPEPTSEQMEAIRASASEHIAQMTHCRRCRADAAGLLGEGLSDDLAGLLRETATGPLNPDEERPFVAVASQEGFLVNQHLGEAERLLVFMREDGRCKAIDSRTAPPPGGGDRRWKTLAQTLADCRVVLVSGAGEAPKQVLAETGLKVIVAEGLIDECLEAVYTGRPVRSPARPFKCGATCRGDGAGCG